MWTPKFWKRKTLLLVAEQSGMTCQPSVSSSASILTVRCEPRWSVLVLRWERLKLLKRLRFLIPFDTNWKKGSDATPLTTQDLFYRDALSIPTGGWPGRKPRE